jgi:hypothetical protein
MHGLLEQYDTARGRWVVVEAFTSDETGRLEAYVYANAASSSPARLRISPISTAAVR